MLAVAGIWFCKYLSFFNLIQYILVSKILLICLILAVAFKMIGKHYAAILTINWFENPTGNLLQSSQNVHLQLKAEKENFSLLQEIKQAAGFT